MDILYTSEQLQEIKNILNVLVALESFRVGYCLFDLVYKMILRYTQK